MLYWGILAFSSYVPFLANAPTKAAVYISANINVILVGMLKRSRLVVIHNISAWYWLTFAPFPNPNRLCFRKQTRRGKPSRPCASTKNSHCFLGFDFPGFSNRPSSDSNSCLLSSSISPCVVSYWANHNVAICTYMFSKMYTKVHFPNEPVLV